MRTKVIDYIIRKIINTNRQFCLVLFGKFDYITLSTFYCTMFLQSHHHGRQNFLNRIVPYYRIENKNILSLMALSVTWGMAKIVFEIHIKSFKNYPYTLIVSDL